MEWFGRDRESFEMATKPSAEGGRYATKCDQTYVLAKIIKERREKEISLGRSVGHDEVKDKPNSSRVSDRAQAPARKIG